MTSLSHIRHTAITSSLTLRAQESAVVVAETASVRSVTRAFTWHNTNAGNRFFGRWQPSVNLSVEGEKDHSATQESDPIGNCRETSGVREQSDIECILSRDAEAFLLDELLEEEISLQRVLVAVNSNQVWEQLPNRTSTAVENDQCGCDMFQGWHLQGRKRQFDIFQMHQQASVDDLAPECAEENDVKITRQQESAAHCNSQKKTVIEKKKQKKGLTGLCTIPLGVLFLIFLKVMFAKL